METLRSSIPISLLRQYCFCPRIPWFNEVKRINPGDRKWQQQGVSYHVRQSMLMKRRQLSRFGFDNGNVEFNVQLRSISLGCHGIVDGLILKDDEVAAVEFKLAGVKPQRGQILQVAAYGMLAEEIYNRPCRQVFILIGDRGKTYAYNLDDRLRNAVTATLSKITSSLSNPILPDSSATDIQCGQCEYYNFCSDR